MPDSKWLARRRARLFAADPHCCYCGGEMVLWKPEPHEKLPGNFATIEHVNPRIGGPRPRPGTTLLACLDCNNRKGADDEKAFRRSGDRRHLTEPIGELVPELQELLGE